MNINLNDSRCENTRLSTAFVLIFAFVSATTKALSFEIYFWNRVPLIDALADTSNTCDS